MTFHGVGMDFSGHTQFGIKELFEKGGKPGNWGKNPQQGCEQKHCLNSHTLQCTSHMVFYINFNLLSPNISMYILLKLFSINMV